MFIFVSFGVKWIAKLIFFLCLLLQVLSYCEGELLKYTFYNFTSFCN